MPRADRSRCGRPERAERRPDSGASCGSSSAVKWGGAADSLAAQGGQHDGGWAGAGRRVRVPGCRGGSLLAAAACVEIQYHSRGNHDMREVN